MTSKGRRETPATNWRGNPSRGPRRSLRIMDSDVSSWAGIQGVISEQEEARQAAFEARHRSRLAAIAGALAAAAPVQERAAPPPPLSPLPDDDITWTALEAGRHNLGLAERVTGKGTYRWHAYCWCGWSGAHKYILKSGARQAWRGHVEWEEGSIVHGPG